MPSQVVIENPVINSPFEEPRRHFLFSDEGITDQIVRDRRVSCYFIPIAQPRKKGPKGQLDDGRGPADPLNLIVEVTGERDKDKAAKVAAARNLWIPAVNNAGTWGRWAFIEIADPWDAQNAIRAMLSAPSDSRG
jgi:hypothetical protein